MALEPSSKWYVNYAETSCVLGRTFGEGEQQVVVAWRSLPLENKIELLIQSKDTDSIMRRGIVEVTLEPGDSDRSTFEAFPTTVEGTRMFRTNIDAERFAHAPERVVMTLIPSKGLPSAYALESAAKGFAALRTCNERTLKEWQIDAEAEKRAISPAKLLKGRFFAQGLKYPTDAIVKGQQGTTAALFTIGLDGRVSDCRIVLKSGAPTMDNAVCDRLTKAAR